MLQYREREIYLENPQKFYLCVVIIKTFLKQKLFLIQVVISLIKIHCRYNFNKC